MRACERTSSSNSVRMGTMRLQNCQLHQSPVIGSNSTHVGWHLTVGGSQSVRGSTPVADTIKSTPCMLPLVSRTYNGQMASPSSIVSGLDTCTPVISHQNAYESVLSHAWTPASSNSGQCLNKATSLSIVSIKATFYPAGRVCKGEDGYRREKSRVCRIVTWPKVSWADEKT